MFAMTARKNKASINTHAAIPFFEDKSVVFQKNEVGTALDFRLWLDWPGRPAAWPVLVEYGQTNERAVRSHQRDLGPRTQQACRAEQNRRSSRNNDLSDGRTKGP